MKKRGNGLTDQLASRCKFFTGVQNGKCEKGITYESVRQEASDGRGYRFPCVRIQQTWTEFRDCKTCSLRELPTPEEVAKEEAEFTKHADEMMAVYVAIREHHKSVPKGNESNVVYTMTCPVCSKALRYRVSGYNGHIHAKCETDGCVQFME